MATVPSYTTFVAGSILTAAQLNSNVRDGGNFWLTVKPVAVTRATAAQSIPNTTFTTVLFDTDDYNNDGMHSTITNTGRLTCVTAGRYLFAFTGGLTSNATGIRATKLQIDYQAGGNRALGGSSDAAGNSTEYASSVVGTELMSVGDYVHMDLYQASGGALNTTITYFGGSNGACRASAWWIHNA
jgi:hypothetical protein